MDLKYTLKNVDDPYFEKENSITDIDGASFILPILFTLLTLFTANLLLQHTSIIEFVRTVYSNHRTATTLGLILLIFGSSTEGMFSQIVVSSLVLGFASTIIGGFETIPFIFGSVFILAYIYSLAVQYNLFESASETFLIGLFCIGLIFIGLNVYISELYIVGAMTVIFSWPIMVEGGEKPIQQAIKNKDSEETELLESIQDPKWMKVWNQMQISLNFFILGYAIYYIL